MSYDILEIKKYDKKINKSLVIIYNDIKILALCGVVLFACEKGLVSSDPLVVGSVSGGTLSIISLVKSICNIYINNEKKRELENDKCK